MHSVYAVTQLEFFRPGISLRPPLFWQNRSFNSKTKGRGNIILKENFLFTEFAVSGLIAPLVASLVLQ